MTPQELAALPPAMAMRVLLDLLPASIINKLEAVEVPKIPFSPKYDGKIFRKGGAFQWCSETSLEGLVFWQKRSLDGVEKGGQYAEKDQKNVDRLQFWIDYRGSCPDVAVTLIRGEETVTASAPTNKPRVWSPLPKDDGPGGYGDPNEDAGFNE